MIHLLLSTLAMMGLTFLIGFFVAVVTLSVIIGILFLMVGATTTVSFAPAAVSGAPPNAPIIIPVDPVNEFIL